MLPVLSELPREEPELRQRNKPRAPPTGSDTMPAFGLPAGLRGTTGAGSDFLKGSERALLLASASAFGVGGAVLRERGTPGEEGERSVATGEDERGESFVEPAGEDGSGRLAETEGMGKAPTKPTLPIPWKGCPELRVLEQSPVPSSSGCPSGRFLPELLEPPRNQHAAQRPLAAGASELTRRAPQVVHDVFGERCCHLQEEQTTSRLD